MLWTILIQAYKISSTKELLQNELKQIEKEFIKINYYPKQVFHQVKENVGFLEMKTMKEMLQLIIQASAQLKD